MLSAWKKDVELDVRKIHMAEKQFRSNKLDPDHVLYLQESILLDGVKLGASAPLHAVCFLSKFKKSIVFFCCLLICIITAEGMHRRRLTLDEAYDLGIYVYAGQHEIAAMQALSGLYQNREYRMRVFGTLACFESRSKLNYHLLRMAGNYHNDIGERRQKRTWDRMLHNIRTYFELGGCNPLTKEDKVYIVLFFVL